ncbi:MAG: hypothetical protein AVDCRST_MAG17-52, partial [uncultured Solirubrobacterales bacterium]
ARRPAASLTPPQRPPAPARAQVSVPGLDRREGRPAAPGGALGPDRQEPDIPNVDVREGRPPGLGGFKPRPPRRRTPQPSSPRFFSPQAGSSSTTQSTPGTTIVVPRG